MFSDQESKSNFPLNEQIPCSSYQVGTALNTPSNHCALLVKGCVLKENFLNMLNIKLLFEKSLSFLEIKFQRFGKQDQQTPKIQQTKVHIKQ